MLEQLGSTSPPEGLVTALHEETDGNPFFVEEVYNHLEEEGRIFDGEGRWLTTIQLTDTDVPAGIRLILDRRLRRLSAADRSLLSYAAVVGRRFSYELLRESVPVSAEDSMQAIERAQEAGLVEPDSESRGRDIGLRFRHELIRQTLLAAVSAPRRQQIHLRVADAIERRAGGDLGTTIPALAYHLYSAGAEADSSRVFSMLVAAGGLALEAEAFSEALANFAKAESLCPAQPLGLLGDLLWKRGRAQRGLGRWEEAKQDWRKALEIFEEADDGAAIGKIARSLGHLLIWSGPVDEAARLAQRGLRSLPDEPSSLRAGLLAIDGWAQFGGSSLKDAVSMSRKIGDGRVEGQALVASSFAHMMRLQAPAQLEDSRRAALLLRAAGDLWNLADALAYYELASLSVGRPDIGEHFGYDAQQLADSVGHLGAHLNTTRARGLASWLATGSHDGLAAAARRCRALCAEGIQPLSPIYECVLAHSEFQSGRWDEAHRRATQAADAEMAPPHAGTTSGISFLMECALGREKAALAVLEERQSLMPRLGSRNWKGGWDLLLAAVEGLAHLGLREQAAEFYPLTLEALQTGTVVSPYATRLLQLTAGISAAAGQRWEQAGNHFETAREQADMIPFRSEQPEVRRWHAKMLLDRGRGNDRERATELLQEALTSYRELGMPKHVEMTEALIGST